MKWRIQQFISEYGINNNKGLINYLMTIIVSHITGYNHEKYWKRRAFVIQKNRNFIKKAYYLYYIKKVDAKHLSSTGISFNTGSKWESPPLLPHGLNRIIIGHDTIIGSNVTIYHGVTVSHGGCIIGDNVVLGANSVILPRIKVGKNAKIGANAVVVCDVPPYATAVGNPARIITK